MPPDRAVAASAQSEIKRMRELGRIDALPGLRGREAISSKLEEKAIAGTAAETPKIASVPEDCLVMPAKCIRVAREKAFRLELLYPQRTSQAHHRLRRPCCSRSGSSLGCIDPKNFVGWVLEHQSTHTRRPLTRQQGRSCNGIMKQCVDGTAIYR